MYYTNEIAAMRGRNRMKDSLHAWYKSHLDRNATEEISTDQLMVRIVQVEKRLESLRSSPLQQKTDLAKRHL